MLHQLESAGISLGLIGLKHSWEQTKALLLDRELIEPPITLNRRKGKNAGRGRGFRRQPDPNSEHFRKFDSALPPSMN
jgi:hypothetical protein